MVHNQIGKVSHGQELGAPIQGQERGAPAQDLGQEALPRGLGLGGLGLGGLTGERILLTTVGRRSGKPRRAAVDVMRHDAATDTYYVLSVWGERSDWFRNLRANPSLGAQVGWRRFAAKQARKRFLR